MKVVNDEGRFQFVKNQIVKIDSRLPKYQKLKLQRSVSEEEYKQLRSYVEPEGGTEESNTNLSPAVTVNNDGQVHVRNRGLMTLDRRAAEHAESVDIALRQLIIEMKEDNTLRTYLESKDAEKFNSAFINILLGEDSRNSLDLQIPNNRWLYENHPIATAADDSDLSFYGVTIGENYIYANNIIEPVNRRENIVQRIVGYFKQLTKSASDATKEAIKERRGLSVIDLFDILHVKKGHEENLLKRLEGYYTLLDNAEANGQTALFDELAQKIFINIYESVLAAHGYTKYIQFGELEELQKKCVRVLDIDYISDFGRVIPSKVCRKKKAVDELCVFDNYCILYYDPTEKTAKKEAKAKRDPILFGLINHSDKLYYIDSWIDDLCDLTIETIADKLGSGAIKEVVDYTQHTDEDAKKPKKTTKRKTSKKE